MRKRLFDWVVMAFCLLLYGYFGWHYFYGSRSVAVQAQLEANRAELLQQLDAELDKRRRLEAKVSLLRPEHVDRDFLDETTRRTLNYVDNKELVIFK